MSGNKIGFNLQTISNLNAAQEQTPKTKTLAHQTVLQTDEYIVKRGDTLTEIAVKTGQNLQELLKKNPQIKNPNRIYVGQHIEIGKQTNTYTVKKGDTLSEIAKTNHTTIGDILRANSGQINNRNLIYPGQKLHLPAHQAKTPTAKPETITPTQTPPTKPIETKTPIPVKNDPPMTTDKTESSAKSPHLKLKSKDVQLSPLVQKKMSQIADEYFKKTGKDLIITDGNRTPHDQAERIYEKIQQKGENIYTNKKALAEIKAAYNEGAKRGESRAQTVNRMAQVIQNQGKQGTYISKHLTGQGADVRISDMTPADKKAFLESVAKVGGAHKLNEGNHWHMEIDANQKTPVQAPPTTPTIPKPQPPITAAKNGELKLGANEEYRNALLLAQRRTGIDAAAIASVINAEAAVNSKTGKWIANSQAGTSSARGLTQFIPSTWETRAKVKGSYLNEVALQRGLIDEKDGQFSIKDRAGLLALRDDPTISVVTGAEFGKDNLAALDRNGFLPKDLSDDEKAKYMYFAHHEGFAGATRHLTDSGTANADTARRVLTLNLGAKKTEALKAQYGSYNEAYKLFAESQARKIFPIQVGSKGGAIIEAYVKKYGNYERGYRGWLNDYTDKKIRPDNYRQ